MITRSWKGRIARDLLDLYENAAGFRTPREESVRTRFSAFHLHHYQTDLLAFLRSRISAPCVFVDVGANIGYVSRAASRIIGTGGKVVAFEPNPTVFALLQENCARLKNVTIHNFAVGEQEGVLSLGFRADHTGEASLLASPGTAGETQVKVPVVTLASYFSTFDAAAKIFLKIDVEGFELPVLRGLGSGRLPDCVIAEYNPKWQRRGGFSPEEFYAWFSSRGYHIHIMGPGGRLAPATLEDFHRALQTTSDTESFDLVGLIAG